MRHRSVRGLSSAPPAPYHRLVQLDQPTTILVTCARGLVESLEREVRELGFTPDASIEEVIQNFIDDELGGRVAD